MTDDTIDKLIGAYIKCRDHLAKLEKEFNQVKKEHNEDMAIIERHLHRLAEEQGVKSFATKSGTAYKKPVDWVKVEDWDAALEFIIENDLKHMLSKSVTKKAAKEYMEANGNRLPIGLRYGYKSEMGIRRN